MSVDLHAASSFSFLRGASLPEDLVERAAELGYDALALVDRDGLAGAPRFFKAARARGIRPIVGAELSLDGGGALPLLVETQRGYRNLCRLITRMKAGVPKGEGRLRFEMLEGMVEGLVALPGVETLQPTGAGPLDTDRLARVVEAFGPGRVLLDVQREVVDSFHRDWGSLIRVEVSDELNAYIARAVKRYPLRGFDLVHLASAMVIRERLPEDFVFACFDDRLARAAQSEGFETFSPAEATVRQQENQRVTQADHEDD